jgi:hypothetical protein
MQIIHDGIKLNLHEREASLVLELLYNYIREGGSFKGKTDLSAEELKFKKTKDDMAKEMHYALYELLVLKP